MAFRGQLCFALPLGTPVTMNKRVLHLQFWGGSGNTLKIADLGRSRKEQWQQTLICDQDSRQKNTDIKACNNFN